VAVSAQVSALVLAQEAHGEEALGAQPSVSIVSISIVFRTDAGGGRAFGCNPKELRIQNEELRMKSRFV